MTPPPPPFPAAPPAPRRRILLHACCGPCSTHCVRELRESGVEPVLFYSNSNIDTEAEFEKRLAALRAFAAAEGVEVLADAYDPASWERAVAGLEAEPEGGARCDRCFRHNLDRAAAKAAELGFGVFSTTLTVSPHKSSPRVFAAGREAAAARPGGPAFEERDFKKRDGFLDSVRLAKAYGLYRQDYCGCRFSRAARDARAAAGGCPSRAILLASSPGGTEPPELPTSPRTTMDTLTRASSPALDAILGQTFKVLDDGFVRVVDYMGNDTSIVQAARVSYGDGTKKGSDDEHLIRYLMRHRHTTPFEMCELKLHVRAPMDVWRQWVRHRTASINEYSTRYSLAIDAARELAPDEWRGQSTTNRQGSGEALPSDVGAALSAEEKDFHAAARALYEKRIEAGVSREIARKDLPLATYTEAYWKCNLKNLLHFLALRMPGAAQYEIRVYAELIGREIVSRWVPAAWKAFCDYQLEAVSFTAPEQRIVPLLAKGDAAAALDAALALGFVKRHDDGSLKVLREGAELAAKLPALGLPRPW